MPKDQIDPYVDEIAALEPGDRPGIRKVLFKVLRLGIVNALKSANDVGRALLKTIAEKTEK